MFTHLEPIVSAFSGKAGVLKFSIAASLLVSFVYTLIDDGHPVRIPTKSGDISLGTGAEGKTQLTVNSDQALSPEQCGSEPQPVQENLKETKE